MITKVNHKFNIGDKLYFIRFRKVISSSIKSISFDNNMNITYHLGSDIHIKESNIDNKSSIFYIGRGYCSIIYSNEKLLLKELLNVSNKEIVREYISANQTRFTKNNLL